jgi:hypothetical protein
MDRGRQAELWGGPEDGARVWMPPGELPRLVGVHRTADGALVPIRGRQLNLERAHVCVYERAGIDVLRAWHAACGPWLNQPDQLPPLYVHRDLVTRWLARGQV